MKTLHLVLATMLLALLMYSPLFALVKYEEGRVTIDGVTLLQDKDNPLHYYYIPKYPKIATHEDGSFEFLCIKYVGQGGPETNGGIFHALVEFSLPQEVIDDLEIKLQAKAPGARIQGMVPLQQVLENGESGMAPFQVVSAILTNTEGEDAFTRQVLTSGHAPFLPGSKAAIAARLSQAGATLMWNSMQSPTSDVSVTVSGYYEAYVKGYNAVVTAEVSTIYEHFSKLMNKQQEYTRRQLRDISDELVQTQLINVEVFDRSEGLGIKNDDMENILNLITDKVIDLMFDAEAGWSQRPEQETAVEQGQIKGRQERGWFSKVFGGARDEKYQTDNQFVMKKREDIRINKFYLNLSKGTSIKVPVYTSGNLGGLYRALGEDERYFRVVNLDDPDFQQRDIHFQVDGDFVESFKDVFNSVTVSFKKSYGDDRHDKTEDIVFDRSSLEKGVDIQSIQYPRLGVQGADWLNYEYRLVWSLKGKSDPIYFPRSREKWLQGKDPAVALVPPFQKRVVEIDADRSFFEEAGMRTASVRFFVILAGEAQLQKTVPLRISDAENTTKVALYHDQDEPVLYQVTWYSKTDKIEMPPERLPDDYLFLTPPID